MHTSSGWVTGVAVFAAAFGLLTVVSGGTALFGTEQARSSVGNAVPFVLWFNFLMGFAYIGAAALMLWRHPKAHWAAWAIGLATAAVFAAFGVAVLRGTPFETRTVGAMTLRTGFWLAIAVLLSVRERRMP